MISPRDFNCAHVIDLLDDYRRNEIEPHLRVLISEHLANCDECATELRTREAMADAMRTALPQIASAAHLPPKVRRTIASQRPPQPTGRRNAQLLPWMLAAAVVVTVGVAMLQMHTATPPLQRPTAVVSISQKETQKQRPMTDSIQKTESVIQSKSAAPATARRESAAPASRETNMPPPAQRAFAPAAALFADQSTTSTAQLTTTTNSAKNTRPQEHVTTSPRTTTSSAAGRASTAP